MFAVSLLEKLQIDFLWYRADRGENSIADIFYFLNLAAQRNNQGKHIALPIFTAEYADDIKAFAKIFFRRLFTDLTDSAAIVFDNCQELEQDESFLSILQMAMNEIPQGMKIVCVSRNQPAAELNRLRLTHEMLEVNADDLRLSDADSRDFMKWLNPALDENTIQSIHSLSRGWMAGMVLSAANPVALKHYGQSTPTFSDNHFLFEYLASEIFERWPSDVREFLLKSALFSQFTVNMGQYLTGTSQAKQFMDDLVSNNCLIERSTGPQSVYTYHPLFRSFLLAKATATFSDKEWRELQDRAASILINENRVEDALSLLEQAQNWQELSEILLKQADSFIKEGRHRAVKKWLEALPASYLEESAWLNYRYALALSPTDPIASASRLDACYAFFKQEKNIIGLYSAWYAAVDAVCNSMDDFSSLDIWFERFEDLRKNHPSCLKLELKAKFYASAIRALSFYKPYHPWLRSMVRMCERFVRIIPLHQVRSIVYTQLGHYYVLTCQLSKLNLIVPYLHSAMNDGSLPPLVRLMNIYLLGVQAQYQGDGDEGLVLFNRGIALSEETGIHLLNGLMHAHIISCHILQGKLEMAEAALNEAFSTINPKQRMYASLFHSYAAWVSALTGHSSQAFEQNQLTIQLTQQIGVKVGYVCSLAFKAQFLAEKQHWQQAERTFSLLRKTVSETENQFDLIQLYLTDAWLGYLQREQERSLSAIRQFLAISRNENITSFFGWRPEVMIPLCISAIENGIEEEFSIGLLRKNPFFSSPPLYLENWPWPVRIYCFERFKIEINGRPLEFSGKSQKKILSLLLTIIAFGGREVDTQQLSQQLWPESDGDYALKALETSIHRLRKLIGKEVVLVKEGRVSIHESICW
ncbi:MAG: hypothetical protein ACU85E_16630, partial [Gammaproteobacteria bacterium]